MLRWMLSKENGGPEGYNLVAVTVGHEVYCFGGYGSSDDMNHLNVHVFNTVSAHSKKLPPVRPGRDGHPLEVPSSGRLSYTAVLIEDVIYIWGGFPYSNVLYAFDVDAHRWFLPNVSGTVPERRWLHSASVLGKIMYIHGGYNSPVYFNDIYKLDTTTMVWSLINTRGTPPPASYWHSATIIGTKMFVFGGYMPAHNNNNNNNTNIRVFDTETNCWLRTPPSAQPVPKESRDHPAFAYNGELYIFYDNRDQDCNNLWKFNPETLSWKKVEPKGKGLSQTHFKSLCMVGDRVFLFGGAYRDTHLNVLDLNPSLKTLCKLTVIQYGLEQSGLPHNIRWELVAMTSNSNRC